MRHPSPTHAQLIKEIWIQTHHLLDILLRRELLQSYASERSLSLRNLSRLIANEMAIIKLILITVIATLPVSSIDVTITGLGTVRGMLLLMVYTRITGFC